MANLLATEQIRFGDMVVEKETSEETLSFHREGEGAAIPMPTRKSARPQSVRIAVSGGRDAKGTVPARDPEPVLS
jgi:hypothetical protein